MKLNLISEIDKLLISKEGRERTSHYPSDVSACNRQLYYKWVNEEKSDPIEAGAIWKMEIGNGIHDVISRFLEDLGLDVIDEIAVKENIDGLKYPLSGRIDNAFIDPDNQISGIEVKTSFGAGIKNIQVKQEPKPEHLAQVICYFHLTDIKNFYIIYIGRDNGYRTQFLIEKDPEPGVLWINGRQHKYSWLDIINKLIAIEKVVANKTLPEREFKAAIKNGEIKSKFQKDKIEYKSDWQCLYCQWQSKCWEKELIEYKDTSNIELFNQEVI